MNRDRKRETDRKAARRRKAIAEGRNPQLVTGEIRPRARIAITSARVPSIPAPRCEGLGDLFFSDNAEDTAAAMLLCRGCPSRADCLAGALARGEVSGVWGGADFGNQQQKQIAS